MTDAPEVHFKAVLDRGELECSYVVFNRGSSPIFIFDKLYNMIAEALDPNWAYVSCDGDVLRLARKLIPTPYGLHVELPPVPYGRVVLPGARMADTFRLNQPFREQGPYDEYLRKTSPRRVPTHWCVLELGWSVVPPAEDLPPVSRTPVSVEGEPLRWLSYGTVMAFQHSVESNIVGADLQVEAWR